LLAPARPRRINADHGHHDRDGDDFRERLLRGEPAARGNKLSHKTAQKMMVLLRGVMGRAKRKGWIDTNPCEDAEKVTVRRNDEFNVLDIEQVQAVTRAASTRLLSALFTVAAFTGLRQGELLTLRWRHVDFANRILHVRKNLPAGTARRRPRSPIASGRSRSPTRRSSRSTSSPGASTSPAPRTSCSARSSAGTSTTTTCETRLRRPHASGARAPADEDRPDRLPRPAPHVDIQTTMRYSHYVPQHDDAARLTAAFSTAATEAVRSGDVVQEVMPR
jgi:integrase